MAKRREKKTYKYACSLTGENFKTTKEAPNPEELMSVRAYYQLFQENDDRPEAIKKQHAQREEEEAAAAAAAEAEAEMVVDPEPTKETK